jgi:hypothetical protein
LRLAPLGLAIALACSTAPAATPTPSQRTLSFEDRVAAQAAIERVYYAHQLGPTKPFDEAVPKSVLEGKVRKYLEQTAALGLYWKTSVTDEMLQRELERMANGTKMPERLTELYAALGNDPFLIKECLARATLVDRLTHNFFAFDSTIHAKAHEEAEALHRRLASGELSVSAEEVHRTVSEIVLDEKGSAAASLEQLKHRHLTAEEFVKQRAELPPLVGHPSELTETRDAFVWRVLISESPTDLRVARYAVRKTTWDEWWTKSKTTIPAESVAPVVAADGTLPMPVEPRAPNGTPCTPDDSWRNGSLSGSPSARADHAAVWTGSLMIVWGGLGEYDSFVDGGRYDPATDSWTSVSPHGAPSASSNAHALWTGHLMLLWTGGISGRYDPTADRWTPISAIGAPSGGGAVWTGSEMIVWGVGAGARYDPETDRWSRMSTAGAPKNTNLQVWTGSLMLAWSRQENAGGRYDPASDRWTSMSSTDAPTDCGGDVAVWTGRQMLLWCENYRFGRSHTFGGRYDPVSDSWSSMSNAGP